MKKKEIKNNNIVAVIPFKIFVTEKDLLGAEFVVFEDGTIGELSKRKPFEIRSTIKNLPSAIRRYLLHILRNYKSLMIEFKGVKIETIDQVKEIDRIRKKIVTLFNQEREFSKKYIQTKDLNEILNKIQEFRAQLDNKITEIKTKQADIANWALRKGTVLMQERKRIQEILDNTFRQLFNLYGSIYEKQKIPQLTVEGLFKYPQLNLLNGLRTILVNFTEREEDLCRIREVIRMCESLLEINNVGEFLKRLFKILEKLAPLVEAPIEIKFNNKKMYLKEGKIYGAL